ncbi:MAG: flagellar basal body rod protein FlgB [Gammaproteobacteria bacterium]|nr:flagellar basal body rod protein FlgB [Gammaproteobacteria bacterium]
MSWLDSALGIHPTAIKFYAQRSSTLAANIANEGTPGFKARDYDFQSVLQATARGTETGLRVTDNGHIPNASGGAMGNLMYRVPTKPMVNGNSVEPEVEQAAFTENALRYQAALEFLDSSLSGLRLAIRGQR